MEQLEFNHPKKYVSNRLQYIIDSIKTFFFDKGFIVTFSGVDGAGKTTIIENVKEILEKKYRKRVVVLRHRKRIILHLIHYQDKVKTKIIFHPFSDLFTTISIILLVSILYNCIMFIAVTLFYTTDITLIL